MKFQKKLMLQKIKKKLYLLYFFDIHFLCKQYKFINIAYVQEIIKFFISLFIICNFEIDTVESFVSF